MEEGGEREGKVRQGKGVRCYQYELMIFSFSFYSIQLLFCCFFLFVVSFCQDVLKKWAYSSIKLFCVSFGLIFFFKPFTVCLSASSPRQTVSESLGEKDIDVRISCA